MAELRVRLPDGEPLICLEHIADMNEILAVRATNEKRAHDAARRKVPRRG